MDKPDKAHRAALIVAGWPRGRVITIGEMLAYLEQRGQCVRLLQNEEGRIEVLIGRPPKCEHRSAYGGPPNLLAEALAAAMAAERKGS